MDWDEFGKAPITTDYKIPRRSTLLLLAGNKENGEATELGRVVAGTSTGQIQALLDKGLPTKDS